MNRLRLQVAPWAAAAAALALAASGLAALAVSTRSYADARASLDSAERLYDARLSVGRAQERLGGGDLEDAVASAQEANEAALRVGGATGRVLRSLNDTLAKVEAITAAAARSGRGATFIRRQTEVAGEILAAISGYQRMAAGSTGETNGYLRRVLRALRRTNRSFPPGPGGRP